MRVLAARLSHALAAIALGTLATPCLAQSLVGTWEGSVTCKAERIKSNNRSEETLLISQPGGAGTNELRVDLLDSLYFGMVFPYGGAQSFPPDATSGVGFLVACTSAPDGSHTAIERIKWKLSEDGGGSLKLTGSWANYYGHGSCKGSFKRTSTTDPNVSACPP